MGRDESERLRSFRFCSSGRQQNGPKNHHKKKCHMWEEANGCGEEKGRRIDNKRRRCKKHKVQQDGERTLLPVGNDKRKGQEKFEKLNGGPEIETKNLNFFNGAGSNTNKSGEEGN